MLIQYESTESPIVSTFPKKAARSSENGRSISGRICRGVWGPVCFVVGGGWCGGLVVCNLLGSAGRFGAGVVQGVSGVRVTEA